jgi:hypothetical protein
VRELRDKGFLELERGLQMCLFSGETFGCLQQRPSSSGSQGSDDELSAVFVPNQRIVRKV